MIKTSQHSGTRKWEIITVSVFLILTAALYYLPTGFEERVQENAVRCKGRIIQTDNDIQQMGMIKTGHQDVTIEILDSRFKGKIVRGTNQLMGRLDIDKIYQPGDTALIVLTLNEDGEIVFVNPQDHYRLGLEWLFILLFSLLLISFGGWVGARSLLSFIFTAMVLWKIVVPLLLKGIDPILLCLGVVTGLCAVVIFLVAGFTRKGLVAFLGAFMGVFTSCLLVIFFTEKFHVHGAVMPFAETLLYSGFGHLDLTRIYAGAVFLSASGAVMDLAMDVAASMDEVISKKPDISVTEAMKSGITVGRAVVGTMTTTLLLAYSGGYITLLMAFMAQGVPPANLFNLIYVAAEVLKTVAGSFGLVTVAPFTAVTGALIYTRKRR